MVRKSSQKSKERVLSSQLKEVFAEKGVSTRGGTTKLTTGGTPIHATLGKSKAKPTPKFSNESLTKLQLKMNVSDRKMNVLGNYLRINCGRASVNKLDDYLTQQNQKLQDSFAVKKVSQVKYVTNTTDESKGKKRKKTVDVELPVVYAMDVEDLVGVLMEERKLDPSQTVGQIGIDKGQGLVKIMLSLKGLETETEEGPPSKKMKYSKGFATNDFKLAGVKKLILLLACPTTERHDNLSTLLDLLDIKAIDFGFSCDIKMILILFGKQAASSKFCCPFCLGSDPWIGPFEPVTIGSLWADYLGFLEAGEVKKDAMKFHNVVKKDSLIKN